MVYRCFTDVVYAPINEVFNKQPISYRDSLIEGILLGMLHQRRSSVCY